MTAAGSAPWSFLWDTSYVFLVLAARLRHGQRRGPEVGVEEAPKVSLSDAQSTGQIFHRTAVQRAFVLGR